MATNDDNDFAMVLWKLRDEEELHDRDENTRAESEQRRVDGELRERYARRSQMVPQVQALLLPEVHEHIQKLLWETRNWLTPR